MKIPRRISTVIINSLKGGVVPRIGLPYITVGRETEIDALLHDVDLIAEGGASFRFIAGRYGSGKSFLLQTIRNYAMDRNFVVADADLSPERRLQGTRGQGLATYKELIQNMSTRTRPEGGALTLILDRWISSVQSETALESGLAPGDDGFGRLVEKKIYAVIHSLNEMVHGFDFARLLTIYYRAALDGDDGEKAKVVKWFRGEYANKIEARAELGVNIVITDDDWYEYIKLFAMFLKKAGYSGLLILIDELVNIYKIPNSITRQYNYEKNPDHVQRHAAGEGAPSRHHHGRHAPVHRRYAARGVQLRGVEIPAGGGPLRARRRPGCAFAGHQAFAAHQRRDACADREARRHPRRAFRI